MANKNWLTLLLVLIVSFFCAPDLQASRENPASCLLFPYYDTTGETISIHTITHVGEESVIIRMVFVDGEDCSPTDFWFKLTPGDTFTFAANGLVDNKETGFLYVYAVKHMHSEVELDADVLIGQELIFGLWDELLANFSLNAVGFQALNLTGDGKLHLDGKEYTLAPKTIYFPRFFGQDVGIYSKLILINLTGGKYFTAGTKILIYNDNEQFFSNTWHFDCFEVESLKSLSGATHKSFLLSTNHDVNEPWPFQAMAETGALRITGDTAMNHTGSVIIPDASVYAVLIEGFGLTGYSAADLPLQIEDGDTHFHAMLWSVKPDGT